MDDRRILLIHNDFLSFFIRRILDSRERELEGKEMSCLVI